MGRFRPGPGGVIYVYLYIYKYGRYIYIYIYIIIIIFVFGNQRSWEKLTGKGGGWLGPYLFPWAFGRERAASTPQIYSFWPRILKIRSKGLLGLCAMVGVIRHISSGAWHPNSYSFTLGFLIHGFWSDRKSSILAVRVLGPPGQPGNQKSTIAGRFKNHLFKLLVCIHV